jgi:hypothetical protein
LSVPFAYLRDPLFLGCFAVYWVHRWAASQGLSTPLLRSYLNDLICLPFWVPMMLWGQRVLRLRTHDDPPHASELVIPLVIWATVFEVMLPATKTWSGFAFPDPRDVLCYAAGGLVAIVFWNWWYARPLKPRRVHEQREMHLE